MTPGEESTRPIPLDPVRRLRVGVSLGGPFPQGVPPAGRLLEAARHAEAAGCDALWSGDHVGIDQQRLFAEEVLPLLGRRQ